MEAALRALVEPRRRAILRLVWDRERAAGEIASHFEVTRPAISQHLSVLKDAGLLVKVEPHRHGVRHCYRCHAVVEPRLSEPPRRPGNWGSG